MGMRTVRTIFRKELLDTLRDKRTLMMMVGVPIILYPALILIAMQTTLMQLRTADASVKRVAVAGPGADTVAGWLDGAEGLEIVHEENPEEALRQAAIHAVVVCESDVDTALEFGGTVKLELRYDSTELASSGTREPLLDALEKVSDRVLKERLAKVEIAQEYVEPLSVEVEDAASTEKKTGNLLGMILPMMMVVTVALGAFYPAVDLTAGEKERGTFESLLASPASKFDIVTGKFLAVFLLAMTTGLLNLASMGATMGVVASQIQSAQDGVLPEGFRIPIHAFLVVLIAMVPLALFIASVMMSVAVFARSFKEAQNYVSPVFILLLLPAVGAGIPGVKMTVMNQFIPIYNVTLLFKGLMTGQAGVEHVFAVFLSTSAYALLGVVFAAWLFQREDVVLSEERGIPLRLRRSAFTPRAHLTPGVSCALFVFTILLLFYAAIPLQMWNMDVGLLLTEYGLLLLPAVFIPWYLKSKLKTTLRLRMPSVAGLLGAVLLSLSALVIVVKLGESVMPAPEEMATEAEAIFESGKSLPGFLWLLFLIALTPAICEEVLFRGAILSGLRPRLGPWLSILVVGLLFGLFHLSVYRLVPTAVLGMALTYLAVRTDSILPGMVMHALNNGLAVCIATGRLPKPLIAWFEEIEAVRVPMAVVAGAVVVLAAAVAIVEWDRRRRVRLRAHPPGH